MFSLRLTKFNFYRTKIKKKKIKVSVQLAPNHSSQFNTTSASNRIINSNFLDSQKTFTQFFKLKIDWLFNLTINTDRKRKEENGYTF